MGQLSVEVRVRSGSGLGQETVCLCVYTGRVEVLSLLGLLGHVEFQRVSRVLPLVPLTRGAGRDVGCSFLGPRLSSGRFVRKEGGVGTTSCPHGLCVTRRVRVDRGLTTSPRCSLPREVSWVGRETQWVF